MGEGWGRALFDPVWGDGGRELSKKKEKQKKKKKKRKKKK